MPATIDAYLDAARARLHLPSDRQLALALGISPTSLNGWRTKRAWPADVQMVKLAELAGLDPDLALLDLNLWRAKGAEAQDAYARLRAALARAGVAGFMAVALGWPAPSGVAGTDPAQINMGSAGAIHYARFLGAPGEAWNPL